MATPTLFERAAARTGRTALVHGDERLTYGDLLDRSARGATRLLAGRDELDEARVCFLVPPDPDWVATQWAVWRAGGIAVPLALAHPPAELAHVLDDADPEAVVAHPELADRVAGPARDRRIPVLLTPALFRPGPVAALPVTRADRRAMILYTSGTTGRPKGVVSTHGVIEAQITAQVEAWGWTAEDRILSHLPLHHVHGIVNVVGTTLGSGASCRMLPGFEAVAAWEAMARGDLTLFFAVPTLYRRLIAAWEAADAATRERWSRGARRLRLMISGSAALPVPTLERWEDITGHRLLERYGMTEAGMLLSNPLEGERRPGHVGTPFPGVELRLVDDEGRTTPTGPGQIQARGPGVFREYWRRPDATAAAFTEDGWFRTGDRAEVRDGAWRILGRESVDILKTGGEKISALEIEDVLRTHRGVADCAVVGVPDPDWGDRVCAAVTASPVDEDGEWSSRARRAGAAGPEGRPSPEALRAFLKERLAPWKVPKEVLLVEALPRNAMGKVDKPAVQELFAGGSA